MRHTYDVPCPFCAAPAGKPCMRMNLNLLPAEGYHKARVKASRATPRLHVAYHGRGQACSDPLCRCTEGAEAFYRAVATEPCACTDKSGCRHRIAAEALNGIVAARYEHAKKEV